MAPPTPASSKPPSTPRKTFTQSVLTGRITKIPPSPHTPDSSNIRAKEKSPTVRSTQRQPPPSSPSRTTATNKDNSSSSSSRRSSSTTKTPKYGYCPRCRTGRLVRSRFHPSGASAYPGRWRFVCSNRIVPRSSPPPSSPSRQQRQQQQGTLRDHVTTAPAPGTTAAANNPKPSTAKKKRERDGGCTYWELLDADPLLGLAASQPRKDPSAGREGEGSPSPTQRTPGGAGKGGKNKRREKEEEQEKGKRACLACGKGVLVERARDPFRWRERVLVCDRTGRRGKGKGKRNADGGEGEAGERAGGCGYQEMIPAADDGNGGDGWNIDGDRGFEGVTRTNQAERGNGASWADHTALEVAAAAAMAAALVGIERAKKKHSEAEVIDLTREGEKEEKEMERLVPILKTPVANGNRRRRPTAAARANTQQAAKDDDFGDFDSNDEKELIQLADKVMDELDEKEELELVELADKASASLPSSGHQSGARRRC